MQIIQTNKVEEDILSTKITVDVLGTATMTAEEEKELLHNYVNYLRYSDITFDDYVKVVAGTPVVCASSDPEAEAVTLALINKEILVDENFVVDLVIDVNKIPDSEVGTKLNTKALVAQAKLVVFATKIKTELERILTEIRAAANDFEGDTTYTL